MARKYELRKRARSQEKTRQRIVEALVDLHPDVGPARTTVKAVAERAGVQRLTVYRHFPDETSMIRACSAHFIADNPLPDPDLWREIDDPYIRTERAISDLYSYHARTEPMMEKVFRDIEEVPALAEAVNAVASTMSYFARIVVERWGVDDENRNVLQAAVGHSFMFDTWRSLVRTQGLDQDQAVQLMTRFVACIATSGHGPE
jgi:AcrR family transcriptional regulator